MAAREYKLLLCLPAGPADGDSCGAILSEEAAREFWHDRVTPVLERQLRTGGPEKFAHGGTLAKSMQRGIQFLDTHAGTLSSVGLSLRWRGASEGTERGRRRGELTLKLRTPDFFAAAAAELQEGFGLGKTKLEEDIGPLAISHSHRDGQHTCFASPPSMWSRFSRSMTVPLKECPRDAKDLLALFPALPALVIGNDIGGPLVTEELTAGPAIRETVFKGTTVEFGDGFSGEFTLTTWELDSGPHQRVSELSYRCKLTEGTITLAASQRACALFVDLQNELGDILERRFTSKTALAVPKRVGSP